MAWYLNKHRDVTFTERIHAMNMCVYIPTLLWTGGKNVLWVAGGIAFPNRFEDSLQFV